ncbi:MAG: hypothetical protein IKS20_06680, partial [Victivallales bacterium]|nr:hypothetical protein [Victivallales bacterium]
ISAPQHELSWLFQRLCHIGFYCIKAYLSIVAHACERFAQCSNTLYSMTDIDKVLGKAESFHAVASKRKIPFQFHGFGNFTRIYI